RRASGTDVFLAMSKCASAHGHSTTRPTLRCATPTLRRVIGTCGAPAGSIVLGQPNVTRTGTASRARSAIEPGQRPAPIVTITHAVSAMVAPAGMAIRGAAADSPGPAD